MKKHLLACGLIVAASAPLFAQTGSTVREDRIWNYSLKRFNLDYTAITSVSPDPGYHFEGSEEVNGKKYLVFRNRSGDAIGLMRQEGNKVYAPVADVGCWPENLVNEIGYENLPDEVLLYDFDAQPGDTYISGSFESGITRLTVIETYKIEVGGEELTVQRLEDEREYRYTVVEGVGPSEGYLSTPQGTPRVTGCQTDVEIATVTDSFGNVRFSENDYPMYGYIINEGMQWSYDVTEYDSNGAEASRYVDGGYHFKGYEVIDGVGYRKLLNGEDETVALMREECAEVYLYIGDGVTCLTESGEEYDKPEVCLYNFFLVPEWPFTSVDFANNDEDCGIVKSMEVENALLINTCGNSYLGGKLKVNGGNTYISKCGGPASGWLHRPHWSETEPSEKSVKAVLRNVKDRSGNIVFEGDAFKLTTDGIGKVFGNESTLSYINGMITADSADIMVYDMAGKRVAQGRGSLSTASLQPGAYIVKAAANALKITVK